MSLLFTLPQDTLPTVAAVDPLDLGGEDIALTNGTLGVTPHGDWTTVRGVDAARQSVIRELPANPNSFTHRSEWGGGLSGLMFKGATSSTRDQAISRATARLKANPRIIRIQEISAKLPETGIQLIVRADAVGGPLGVIDKVFK